MGIHSEILFIKLNCAENGNALECNFLEIITCLYFPKVEEVLKPMMEALKEMDVVKIAEVSELPDLYCHQMNRHFLHPVSRIDQLSLIKSDFENKIQFQKQGEPHNDTPNY